MPGDFSPGFFESVRGVSVNFQWAGAVMPGPCPLGRDGLGWAGIDNPGPHNAGRGIRAHGGPGPLGWIIAGRESGAAGLGRWAV